MLISNSVQSVLSILSTVESAATQAATTVNTFARSESTKQAVIRAACVTRYLGEQLVTVSERTAVLAAWTLVHAVLAYVAICHAAIQFGSFVGAVIVEAIRAANAPKQLSGFVPFGLLSPAQDNDSLTIEALASFAESLVIEPMTAKVLAALEAISDRPLVVADSEPFLKGVTVPELRTMCSSHGIQWRNAHGKGKHLRRAEMVTAIWEG